MTVKCSSGHESPDGSAFCDECGEPLTGKQPVATASAQAMQACPSCGAQNVVGDAFCSDCGVSLLGAPAVVANPVPQPASVTAKSARLLVEANNQEFDLSGEDNITIGRDDVASSTFPDVNLGPHGGDEGYVSRIHARIFYESGRYMLEDQNSTNFTTLNRQRLAPKTPIQLHDNDEIRLGTVRLRFKTP